MNNLFSLLLASDGAAVPEETPDLWGEIVPQYVTFGIIIAVSIVLLIILRRSSRLPRHGELRKKLASLAQDIAAISPEAKRMDFIKSVTHAMYKADKIAYAAAMLAEKEKYADLGTISSLVGEARSALAPYKLGKMDADEPEGLNFAAEKVNEALAVIGNVIERDGELKRK